jgi:hypothetical protein
MLLENDCSMKYVFSFQFSGDEKLHYLGSASWVLEI